MSSEQDMIVAPFAADASGVRAGVLGAVLAVPLNRLLEAFFEADLRGPAEQARGLFR